MMKNSHETLVIHNAIAVLKDRLLPDAFIRIENGRIAEHWDVMQPVPELPLGKLGMF